MNICIPVNEDKGLQSPVCAHFGSAPTFLIVDTETESCRPVTNTNKSHSHGMCQPLAVLAGEDLDSIAVGGIGMGAVMKLKAAGVDVFISNETTVAGTVAALAAGRLRPVTPETACGHHGRGAETGPRPGGCGHN